MCPKVWLCKVMELLSSWKIKILVDAEPNTEWVKHQREIEDT